MKRLISVCFAVSLLFSNRSDAQHTVFQKIYGGNAEDVAYRVRETSDKGFIIAGYTKSFGPGSFENAYLLKTDSLGNRQWSRTYGIAGGATKARDVVQVSDGGYLLVGYNYLSSAKGFDILVIRTDAMGNEIWNKSFGGPGGDSASSVLITDDGFLISGNTSGTQSNRMNAASLIKLNAVGSLVWSRALYTNFNSTPDTTGYGSVMRTIPGTGGELLTLSYGGGILKTSSTGHPLASYNGHSIAYLIDPFGALMVNDKGNYVICGTGGQAGGADITIGEYDTSRNNIWMKSLGGTNHDYPMAVVQLEDGGYVVAGHSQSFGFGDADAYLLKTDSVGNHLWSRKYGGNGDDYFMDMMRTTDGGLIMVGFTNSYPGGKNILLVKTDTAGYHGCPPHALATLTHNWPAYKVNLTLTVEPGVTDTTLSYTNDTSGMSWTICADPNSVQKSARSQELKVYPNPASDQLYIVAPVRGIFEVIDIHGRRLLGEQVSADTRKAIRIDHLPDGVYYYQYRHGSIQSGTLIIDR